MMMFALFAVSGIVGGTTLACVAPRFQYEKHVEIAGAILFIAALASIGVGMASKLCL